MDMLIGVQHKQSGFSWSLVDNDMLALMPECKRAKLHILSPLHVDRGMRDEHMVCMHATAMPCYS